VGHPEQRLPKLSTTLSTSVDKRRGSCTERKSNKQVVAERGSQEMFSTSIARVVRRVACGNVNKGGQPRGAAWVMSVDKSTDPSLVCHYSPSD